MGNGIRVEKTGKAEAGVADVVDRVKGEQGDAVHQVVQPAGAHAVAGLIPLYIRIQGFATSAKEKDRRRGAARKGSQKALTHSVWVTWYSTAPT